VLQELGVLNEKESRVILGAAVIDDILAMLLLGIVTSFQATGEIHPLKLTLVAVQAIAFVAVISFLGTKIVKRSSDFLDAPINPLSPLTLALAGCLALAVASAYVGLAAIIGAFLAGMILAESKQRHTLEKQMQPILAFLVPFFFVVTGAKVDLQQIASSSILIAVLVVTILAILSKLIGCGLAAASLGKRSALIIGVGMVPRGEVGIIVASLGLSTAVFSNTMYTIIIVMSLLTSMVAPPLLKLLFSNRIARIESHVGLRD
jgi:Kef-type K+ transport system membrane component KefB